MFTVPKIAASQRIKHNYVWCMQSKLRKGVIIFIIFENHQLLYWDIVLKGEHCFSCSICLFLTPTYPFCSLALTHYLFKHVCTLLPMNFQSSTTHRDIYTYRFHVPVIGSHSPSECLSQGVFITWWYIAVVTLLSHISSLNCYVTIKINKGQHCHRKIFDCCQLNAA